jgi:hypothetical protein
MSIIDPLSLTILNFACKRFRDIHTKNKRFRNIRLENMRILSKTEICDEAFKNGYIEVLKWAGFAIAAPLARKVFFGMKKHV